ncbi:MAG TPA: hypothetical protein PK711_01360 [Bacteroidales bacterium]|nr:hypothetical protein [Bacteroidales bacterium]HRZ20447.1 hypothetical protein [Bacteroidales bacterium]
MRNRIAIVLVAGSLFLLTGCPWYESYEDCSFPGQVQNFASVNSAYDDYNAAAPFIEYQLMLKFSSNRNSNGQDFDLIVKNAYIYCDRENGELTIDSRSNQDVEYAYLDSLLAMANTPGNELGPTSVVFYYWENKEVYSNLLIFSSDTSGNQDLYAARYYMERDANLTILTEKYDFVRITSLNTEANECYMGLFGANFINYSDWYNYPETIQEIYFCSDRDGNYDIFQTDIPEGYDEISFLSADTVWPVDKNTILSSEADDKCPFINGKVLVFASNRAGGFGGYDLYYSRRENGTWTVPRNFGEKINTSSDEYRPIVLMVSGFTNELMFFSSNRTGGKGGFDLYYVGIPSWTMEEFKPE